MLNPNSLTYIDDFIRDSKNDITSLKNIYDTMIIQDKEKGDYFYRVAINDFFLKYRIELTDALQLFRLKEESYYKPKSVSFQLYGTTELWLSLLRANNMRSVMEFNKPVIKAYNPDRLAKYMNIFLEREGKSL